MWPRHRPPAPASPTAPSSAPLGPPGRPTPDGPPEVRPAPLVALALGAQRAARRALHPPSTRPTKQQALALTPTTTSFCLNPAYSSELVPQQHAKLLHPILLCPCIRVPRRITHCHLPSPRPPAAARIPSTARCNDRTGAPYAPIPRHRILMHTATSLLHLPPAAARRPAAASCARPAPAPRQGSAAAVPR